MQRDTYNTITSSHCSKTDLELILGMPTGTAETNEMDLKVETGCSSTIQTDSVFMGNAVDPVYQAKAKILNEAMQEIGMGRYQWLLFFVTGFGYWGSVSALILTSVVNEFRFNGPFLYLSQSIGVLVGAIFWGFASDIWGRKIAFNSTLFIRAVSTAAAGASPNYITLCALATVWSIGDGGNYPVDCAILLGLAISLVYFGRPKYLMSRGRDADAVAVIHWLAKYNGARSSLKLEDLSKVGNLDVPRNKSTLEADERAAAPSTKVARFHAGHIKGLFATKKLAYSTSLLIILSILIGLAGPLYASYVPYYLATRGAYFGDGTLYTTYRNQVILSAISIPGCLLAGWMVDIPKVGRKGALAISSVLTGVFTLTSTTSRSSNALLGWNCAYSLSINAMASVYHGIGPELFFTKDRGTGMAILSATGRGSEILAPLVALYANIATSAPIFISGAMLVVNGLVALLLPFETRGHASL
ncbi:hypothetical protein H0H92_015246 [Tricholoma furcatifolium]|nr:hypothetical protein H0H92_015246 [Tricholoma furcatifolium]